MTYIYTLENRIITPHSYTYSDFGGNEFLKNYFFDRENRLSNIAEHFQTINIKGLITVVDLFLGEEENCIELTKFSINSSFQTIDLLRSLLFSLRWNQSPEAALWLPKLIQRFEVSKKIYSSYGEGFRKGAGSFDALDLYYIFGLCISLYYSKSSNLQLLSSLLKLNDLLLSLPISSVKDKFYFECVPALVSFEVASIKQLIEDNNVCSLDV